ncbi:MAG TPA: nucleoside triphosphate pyrophosphohydrolase [Candidatus Deferrimicrobiaceae bacterium]|jgi:tetrapyrrole methylase family protein/MazG family protein
MQEFDDLVAIMARLRSDNGCEWDRIQTHDSLRQYLLEETHEVVEAITHGSPEHLCEELGDLVLQVLFHARIAEEAGQFDISDVLRAISEKMIRRHPHVFGTAVADTPEAVARQWEHIKKTVENRTHDSLIDGIPRGFPALLRAAKVSRKVARAGFDWSSTEHVMEKVDEELNELKTAISEGDPTAIEHELGDVFLALVNLGRFIDVQPETAVMKANSRFEKRFRTLEIIAMESGISIDNADMGTLDRLWIEAKKRVG